MRRILKGKSREGGKRQFAGDVGSIRTWSTRAAILQAQLLQKVQRCPRVVLRKDAAVGGRGSGEAWAARKGRWRKVMSNAGVGQGNPVVEVDKRRTSTQKRAWKKIKWPVEEDVIGAKVNLAAKADELGGGRSSARADFQAVTILERCLILRPEQLAPLRPPVRLLVRLGLVTGVAAEKIAEVQRVGGPWVR